MVEGRSSGAKIGSDMVEQSEDAGKNRESHFGSESVRCLLVLIVRISSSGYLDIIPPYIMSHVRPWYTRVLVPGTWYGVPVASMHTAID